MKNMEDVSEKYSNVANLVKEIADLKKIETKYANSLNLFIFGTINSAFPVPSYNYLKSLEDYLIKSKKEEKDFFEVSNNIFDFSKRHMFLDIFNYLFDQLRDKSREELLNIYGNEHNLLNKKISYFKNGFSAIGCLNREFFGMTIGEMNDYAKTKGVKKFKFMENMNDDLIRCYIVLLEFVLDITNKKIEKLKIEEETGQTKWFGTTSEIKEIASEIKELYYKNYEKTPFESIEENAFTQINISEIYPDLTFDKKIKKRKKD